MERLIITRMPIGDCQTFVYGWQEDGQINQLHLENPNQNSLLGSIHVGVVQKILPNIHGMFIEIDKQTVCFHSMQKGELPILQDNHRRSSIKAGDRLLVQVTQEALKSKSPQVSFQLSFPGKYLVLTTDNTIIGVSGKISDTRKKILKEALLSMKEQLSNTIPEQEIPMQERLPFGIIVRTNAAGATGEQLQAELERLYRKMCQIIHRGLHSPAHTCIQSAPDFLEKAIQNQYWDRTEMIATDLPSVMERLQELQKKLLIPEKVTLKQYEDPLLPLYKLYRLEHHLEEGLKERIWLKSGGFLVIQQTEAFVVIDVNSGKYTGTKRAREEYHKINQEAAREIHRQMTLRNLYGIILIDFINMRQKEEQEHLLHTMSHLVSQDQIPTKVIDITALGIMELTRKKEEKSLHEQYLSIISGGNYE